MASAGDWVDAARPKTLGAAVAPVVVGVALAWRQTGAWEPWLAVCTLGSCMALQVATNWFNDAIDSVKGADTAARLGPRRITASGSASAQMVLRAALLMLGVAVLLAFPLLIVRGWPILLIGLPSLYFCYGYTGGPCPLAYRGLGELFVILFFGLVAVTGTYFVQTGHWEHSALLAGLQVGCLSTVLIAINNLRDADEDATTGKCTLAVRVGKNFARWEITALCLLPHALGCYAWGGGALFLWPLGSLLLGMVIIVQIHKGAQEQALNGLLAAGGMQLVVFTALYLYASLR